MLKKQTKLEDLGFRKRREETQALSATQQTSGEGTSVQVPQLGESDQSHKASVSQRKQHNKWKKFTVVTYNIENFTEERLQTVIQE